MNTPNEKDVSKFVIWSILLKLLFYFFIFLFWSHVMSFFKMWNRSNHSFKYQISRCRNNFDITFDNDLLPFVFHIGLKSASICSR